jgi:glycosyltransferase involved in cell wall biosynthesis
MSQIAPVPGPRVTTIIPAHQAGRFIARGLRSALNQRISNHEIIVVDDASSDETEDIVRSFGVAVRLIRHSSKRGVSAARNTGIRNAHGAFVAFLDADDEWIEGKLQRQLDILQQTADMSLIASEAFVGRDGERPSNTYKDLPRPHGSEAWKVLLAHPAIHTSTVVARRDALMQAGLFNEHLRVSEDQDLWIRLALQGTMGHIAEPLARIHLRADSLSHAPIAAQGEIMLPMILTHVARNLDRLTDAEVDAILGERFSRVGRAAYASGEYIYGMRCLLRSIAHGHRPARNLLFMLHAAPGARHGKSVIKRLLTSAPQESSLIGPRKAPQMKQT